MGNFTHQQRAERLARQGGRCACCQATIGPVSAKVDQARPTALVCPTCAIVRARARSSEAALRLLELCAYTPERLASASRYIDPERAGRLRP